MAVGRGDDGPVTLALVPHGVAHDHAVLYGDVGRDRGHRRIAVHVAVAVPVEVAEGARDHVGPVRLGPLDPLDPPVLFDGALVCRVLGFGQEEARPVGRADQSAGMEPCQGREGVGPVFVLAPGVPRLVVGDRVVVDEVIFGDDVEVVHGLVVVVVPRVEHADDDAGPAQAAVVHGGYVDQVDLVLGAAVVEGSPAGRGNRGGEVRHALLDRSAPEGCHASDFTNIGESRDV